MSEFILRNSFLKSAHVLQKDIAKKVWKALSLFLANPQHPGLHYEKLQAPSGQWSSIRVDQNYRIILIPGITYTVLGYVGRHDDAYEFANLKQPIPEDQASMVMAEQPAEYGGQRKMESAARISIEAIGDLLIRTVKYLPLSAHLLSLPETARSIALAFNDIERIIGNSLPPSARTYRAWWANDKSRHVQASAWMAVGWKTVDVKMAAETVTFERQSMS